MSLGLLLVVMCFAVSAFAARGAFRTHKARFVNAFNEPSHATAAAAWGYGVAHSKLTAKFAGLSTVAILAAFVGFVGIACL